MKSTPTSLRQLWPHVRPFLWAESRLTIFGLVFSLLSIASGLLLPWPMQVIVDNILIGSKPMPAWLQSITTDRGWALAVVCVGLLLIHLARGALSAWGTVYLVRAGLRMMHGLRCRLYEHLQRLGLVFHDNRAVGESTYRVTGDTFSIQTLFNGGLIPLITSVLTLIGIMIIMLRFDFVLTLLALGVAPLLVISMRLFNRRIAATSIEYHEHEGKVSAVTQESLAAIRTVQAFAREADESRRFETHAAASVEANVRMTQSQVYSSFVVGAITALGTVAMTWVGGERVLTGRLSVGELLVFISYVGMLYGPLNTMSSLSNTVHGALGRLGRVVEILRIHPTIEDKPQARALTSCRGEVRFENVVFGYNSDKPVLRGINFEARPGQMVALVGASGAGKTTLLSLLLRFYDPQEGRVLVDGADVREFQYRSLRRQISIVPQEPILFSSNIAENIAYGRPEATPDEIRAAARQAEAHGFIEALEHGYETTVGERGAKLSGGQRQRLALARAFLKNSPILMLDEPTAALDAEIGRAHV